MSTHDLVEILLDLPLDISRAMYVEGGPQAQLYVNAGGQIHEFTGRLMEGRQWSDGLHQAAEAHRYIESRQAFGRVVLLP